MIIAKGPVEPIATAHELRKRVAALKHLPLSSLDEDKIAAMEPLAAALEAFEEKERAAGSRLVVPTVEVWH